jgi:hypothetical protein
LGTLAAFTTLEEHQYPLIQRHVCSAALGRLAAAQLLGDTDSTRHINRMLRLRVLTLLLGFPAPGHTIFRRPHQRSLLELSTESLPRRLDHLLLAHLPHSRLR